MGRKKGGYCAPFSGEQGPRIYNVAWVVVYVRTKLHLDPCSHLATIDTGPNLGAPPPFSGGGLGPHLSQSRLG